MVAFLGYTDEPTQQYIIGGSDVEISAKSFRDYSSLVCVIVDNCNNVYIHDLDFDGCLGCILVVGCDGEIRIEDIRARNTGIYVDGGDPSAGIGSGKSNIIQFINSRTGGGSSGIRRIIGYGGHTEDMINLYGDSGGLDASNPLIVEEVHLQSPLTGPMSYGSGSGSGINLADGGPPAPSFVICRDSSVLDAGQCGIQNYSGSGIKIRDNVAIHRDKLRSNAGIYTPWTGGPYGGGYDTPVVDNEVSGNRILWNTHLNGNRVFGPGGTYYPSSAETCIYDGGDSTPNPVTGLSPQTNVIQDETLVIADYVIDPDTMIFAGDIGGGGTTPDITANTPFRGSVEGGTEVIISGTGFTDVTSVEFGGEAATFDVVSDTQIVAITPPHLSGIVAISLVTEGAGTSAPPPAGGYFDILAVGDPLPGGMTDVGADIAASAAVHNSSWEPRPANNVANHNTVSNTLDEDTANFDSVWNSDYLPRVSGNFEGTTDEIIQWAAYKWGWDDELLRAQCIQESTWRQNTLGDYEAASGGHRVSDRSDDPTPTSFSIIQCKWYYHPPIVAVGGVVTSSTDPGCSYPKIFQSTAFALDYFLCMMRGIYDGHSTYLNGGGMAASGDEMGAIGSWFSGAWHDSGANSYIASVEGHLADKVWLDPGFPE